MALVVVFIISPIFLKRQWRLFFAVPVSVLQLYVPGSSIGGFVPPLALLGGLSLWPEFIRGGKILLRWPPTLMLVGIMLMYGLSLAWSVDIRMGMRSLIYFWVFLAIFSAIVLQVRRDEKIVKRLLNVAVLFAVIEAFLVILFRMNPRLEMIFFNTDIAQVFINPNVLDELFSEGKNNVLDPSKSGGFFVNGNVAGAYLWIMTMVALLLGKWDKKPLMYVVSAFILMATLFTGSKIVIFLVSVLMPIVLIAMLWNYRMRAPLFSMTVLTIGIIGCSGLMADQLFSSVSVLEKNNLLQQTDSAFDMRIKIWGYGKQVFSQAPLLGQGFGGWQKGYPQYAEAVGISKNYPPHNTWLYIWSQGGLFAAIMGVIFVLVVIKYGVSGLTINENNIRSWVSVSMLGAFIWTFSHGMGTNFGLVGDVHMMPMLSMLLALVYVASSKKAGYNYE